MTNESQAKLVQTNLPSHAKRLANEFLSNFKKSAESVLECARIAAEANNMGSEIFNDFCKQVGYEKQNSTISKFVTIGKSYATLLKKLEHLPSSWTTLYEIAKLPECEIDELIKKGKLHRLATKQEIFESSPKGTPLIQHVSRSTSADELKKTRKPSFAHIGSKNNTKRQAIKSQSHEPACKPRFQLNITFLTPPTKVESTMIKRWLEDAKDIDAETNITSALNYIINKAATEDQEHEIVD